MKAAVVRAFAKPLTIEEVLMPTPGPGEALITATLHLAPDDKRPAVQLR